MAANWQSVTIPSGQQASDPIDISADDVSVPPGKARTASGGRVKGKDFTVEEVDADSCQIVLVQPAVEDVTFKVKAETGE